MTTPSPSIPTLPNWGPCTLQKRCYVVHFSCNLTRVRSQVVMWLHGWLPVTISHYPTKFGGHRPCRAGDIMFSIWHLTSCDPVIKESHNLILGFVSPYFLQHPATFAEHISSGERNILYSIRHMASVWVTIDFLNNCILKKLHDFFLAQIFLRKMSCSFKVYWKKTNIQSTKIGRHIYSNKKDTKNVKRKLRVAK